MYLRLMRFRSTQLSSSVNASASCMPDESMASGTGGSHCCPATMLTSCTPCSFLSDRCTNGAASDTDAQCWCHYSCSHQKDSSLDIITEVHEHLMPVHALAMSCFLLMHLLSSLLLLLLPLD